VENLESVLGEPSEFTITQTESPMWL
jgi:hypothetical protein